MTLATHPELLIPSLGLEAEDAVLLGVTVSVAPLLVCDKIGEPWDLHDR